MTDLTIGGLVIFAWVHGLFIGWMLWGRSSEKDSLLTGTDCPHCRGLGYDDSGHPCKCLRP